jgi:hypothetical protein
MSALLNRVQRADMLRLVDAPQAVEEQSDGR